MLNHCDTARMPDCWTINPYRGCSFGCRYCYARYTHEFLGLSDPLDFERQIFVKTGAGSVLAAEASQSKLQARPIAIGTATDPYQPAEAKYAVTRSILEVLARFRGLEIGIITKSALIVRDLDLLVRICERSRLTISVSLITPFRTLARKLDPGAPTPERRLKTVQTLAQAGLPVGINALPILPAINDPPQDGSDARTGGSPGRDQRAPYSPGDQRPPPRPRAPVPARSGLRRQVDLGGAALLGLRQSPSLPRLALRDDAREAAGIPASVRTRDGRRPALGGRAQATRCGAAQAHGTARSRFSRAWRSAAGAPRAGSLGRDGGSTLLA